MLEKMVQPFNGLQFVLRARWQSATQSAKIARRLHLHIFRTIKGKDGTGDVSKQRTDIQSQEMLHIGSLELHTVNGNDCPCCLNVPMMLSPI